MQEMSLMASENVTAIRTEQGPLPEGGGAPRPLLLAELQDPIIDYRK
jgi:hypothetical protein